MQHQKVRMSSLDACRMFACIMVVAYHYFFIGPLEQSWPPDKRIDAFYFGNFGVDLFFVISGFVITLSSQGRTPAAFLRARVNRIVPTFIVCGLVVFCFSVSLPGVSASERVVSLLWSWTFFPRLFGVDYFSAIYWTLSFEVTFYAWVCLLMWAGLWERYRDGICVAWCVLSLANLYYFQATWVKYVFLSDYSGCFIAGIVFYQIKTGVCKRHHLLLLMACVVLVQAKMQSYNQWIAGYGAGVGDFSLWAAVLVLFGLAWLVASVDTLPFGARLATFSGALSYPFYLLHADIGFWANAIFVRKWFAAYPWLETVVGYPVVVTLALGVSLGLSAVVVMLIDPLCQRWLRRGWQRLSG